MGKNSYINMIDDLKQGNLYSMERVKAISKSWEEYVKNGEIINAQFLRPEILSSWQRSKQQGLNPYDYEPVVINKELFEKKIEKNRVLIETCSVLANDFLASLKDTGFRIDILDPDLVIIKQFGEEENIKKANDQGTFPGVRRNEEFVGTNAPCMAAILGKPIQLVGPEHYKAELQYWTCSAAPLFDKKGDIICILNLVGHYTKAHEHTLGMTRALSKAIEFCYYQQQISEEKELAMKYMESIINTISDGLIAIDTQGIITIFNKTAGKLLGVRPESLIGKDIWEMFDHNSTIFDTLRNHNEHLNSELVFSKGKKRTVVVGNLMPIEKSDKSIEALAIFKGMKHVTGFVQNIAGFKAFFTFDDLIGNNPIFTQAKSLAIEAAKLPSYVLLQGESGTGKELFAQAIHNASESCDGPFVAINCGAIPAELIESELFGYEEGAFTGAKRGGQPGKLQLAEGGTLFLDEINSTPLNMQVKLLRVLQTKKFMRVGGKNEIDFRARVITASNKDLSEEISIGNFRKDLFYRINVIAIYLPLLRERKDDIPMLIDYFCIKLTQRLKIDVRVSARIVESFLSYDWPGNIRELENALERSAVITYSKGRQTIEELYLINKPGLSSASVFGSENILVDTLDTVSKEMILKVLKDVSGNKSKAARVLGITRKTLNRKIIKYSIEV